MRNIIKVNQISEVESISTRPLLAMDSNGVLFAEGKAPAPAVEFVDLGLSVKWAKYNLGATHGNTAASWYGNYYQWGSQEIANEKYCGGSGSETDCPYCTYFDDEDYENFEFSKYLPDDYSKWGTPDNKLVLDAVDDPATLLGGNWRMPTKTELEELLDTTKVTNVWVTNYNDISGLNGRVFTSVANGNTLFIPASGSRYNGSVYLTGSYCGLWSSSLNSGDPFSAWGLSFYSGGIDMNYGNRCVGLTVRPVSR